MDSHLPTYSQSESQFPIKENESSSWSWAHDGENESGTLKLFAGGTVSWNGTDNGGNWSLASGGTILNAFFGGVSHKLDYDGEKANLIMPVREPPSIMKLIAQEQAGTVPLGSS